MGESNEHLLKVVRHCQESLDRYTENRNDGKLLHYLEKLYKLPIKVAHLEETGVGRTVNGLRKLGGSVGDSAKSLVSKWKEMVVGEQKAQNEEEDDDEDDDDDDEDGYQTGEEQSESDDSDVSEETVVTTSSSHKKRDNNRTDERDKLKKPRNSSSKSDHTSQSSSSKKEKDRHSKHNGHHKHKSHKRKSDDTNSEDDSHRKRSRTSEDEDRHKRRKIDSEDETRTQEKKHKSERHRSDSKKRSRESSDGESSHKTAKPKDGEKDKHKSHKKRHEHGSKTKDVERKSKHKEKPKERSDERKPKKEKVVNGVLVQNGIDSGSGASFAEALGMCEPSSSKGSAKKKSLEKREKSVIKLEDPVPKLLLKEPVVEPLDINIASLLPSITPNYRPLGNALSSEMQPKKFLSESETLSNIISSKNQRTKVYSGNKTGNGKVSSLFELCIRILQDNIDALEYTGGVPYNILKPILEKATPNQLYTMEHHNPYLIEDTDELWQLHCQKDFRNKPRQELETCREMYLRCLDERDAKLKALTANIKQAQDKSLPVRMTKLAYVDAVAKPPRNIARKQAKNGTAFEVRKPTMTPTAKLSSLATAGDAGKIAVPNPGGRAYDRPSGHAAKPKKAPLMLKSITSFKNRFKR